MHHSMMQVSSTNGYFLLFLIPHVCVSWFDSEQVHQDPVSLSLPTEKPQLLCAKGSLSFSLSSEEILEDPNYSLTSHKQERYLTICIA